MGRHTEAEQVLKEVLAINEVLGLRHPETAKGIIDLAAIHPLLEMYAEAHELGEQALYLFRDVHRKKQPYTIEVMSTLAGMQHHLKREEEAAKAETEVPRVQREILGPRHPKTIVTMRKLAGTFTATEAIRESRATDVSSRRSFTADPGCGAPYHHSSEEKLKNLGMESIFREV